jgi:hypothetical protein
MRIGLIILSLSLIISLSSAVEFYYTLPRRQLHCFEENLADSILVVGEISFTSGGPINFRIWNPQNAEIKQEVQFYLSLSNSFYKS